MHATSEHEPLVAHRSEHKARTPLPRQIYVIMIICLAEPIAATVIYPFVIELVGSLDVTGGDERKVGYYAGMIESIFFLTETCLIFHYGRLSDKVGRRPVVLFGLFGLALSITSFGLSRTFLGLILSRALSGALNGNAGVIKSIVAELTDSTNQAHGFALLSVTWYLGSTLGPLIGGTLSRPAERFPEIFGRSNTVWRKLGMAGFWKTYPYFLPCFVAAGVAACAWCVALVFLRETLPTKRIHLVRKATSEYGAIEWNAERAPSAQSDMGITGLPGGGPTNAPGYPESISSDDGVCPQPGGLRAVMTPQVGWAVGNFTVLALVDVSWVVLQPLVFATPSPNGLGLSPPTIGLILAAQGLLGGTLQATLFHRIHARFGSIKVYRAALISYAIMFGTFIWMVRCGLDSRAGKVLLAIHVLVSCIASLGFGCTYILISSASPSRALLGTTNGLAQTSCSLVRALGPAGAASLFALSSGVGAGTMVYWVCISVVGLAGGLSLGLEE